MSMQINTETVSTAPEISCHLLPCEIHHNEEANVCKYFETTIRKEDDLLTGCMHGRPLDGEKVALPSGYTGLVVIESRKAATEEEDRMLDIKSKFNEFTYWNLDKPTSKEDMVSKALQWIDIANILHSPINQDECSQRSVTGK